SEVVVIGASQAGLLCAAELARGGIAVEVFENLAAPEEVLPRTLIVTPHLGQVLGDSAGLPVRSTVSAFRIWVNGRFTEVLISEPDWVIDRRDLIRSLAEVATSSGVRIHWGVRLLSVSPTPHGFELLFLDRNSGQFFKRTVSVLVAADGATSTVAQSLNANGKLTVPILQAYVRTAEPVDPCVVDTWFLPERTPYFFWQIPDSERTAAVGCVVPEGRKGKREFFRFLREIGVDPLRVEAALVPLYDPLEKPYRRFGNAELYLVGDAAGHVKVTTVGGTVTGLLGARAAARAILRRTSYVRELRELRRELYVHYLLRRVLDAFDSGDYDRLVACLNRRVLGLLRDVPRDRFASIFLRTLLAQPALAVLGVKGLVRSTWIRLRGRSRT
ncbi:MAG: FAD-dependent monooxygenase, partial [candidate division KSB1 bacterium]|nr:FAD-dependent monooxygenase [candidate division KSB1 bacterium]